MRFPTLEIFAVLHGDALSVGGFPLSERQIALARPIFGDSLRYEDIRIVISSIANAPTTLGAFVRVARPARIDDPLITDRTLIHELMHVWQFQTRGTRYISNSLCHQAIASVTAGSRNAAYTLSRSEVVAAGSIDRLPAEKQATLVEYWFAGADFDSEPAHPGAPLRAVRDEPVCAHMLAEVRAARPLPMSEILEEAAWGAGRGTRRLLPDDDRDAQVMPLIRFEF